MLGPIFAREALTLPRRGRHYVVRAAYLGLLWMIGLTAWQVAVGWSETTTLGDNAQFGTMLFQFLTRYVQLPLVVFFAALTAASAVAQEKDRRTFVLLLITDLRSYEIVLGKLLGSLLQIGLLLLGVIPLLALIMLLGGVAPSQVWEAVLVLAAAALAAGSVGNLVALWRDKTFQALALTVLFLVLYLSVVQAAERIPEWLSPADVGGQTSSLARADWKAWLDPVTALGSVLEPAEVSFLGIPPAYGFAAVMAVLSIALNAWSIVRLRVWNPSGEPIMQREAPEEAEEKDRALAHAAPGAARTVWENPILWREIRTRAYGRRPLLVKIAYAAVVALLCYYAFAGRENRAEHASFAAAVGLVPVCILSLLLISAQAVTAITSERDGGALDLLLVTDLSPNEFIFGKLWGILYNVKEFILPPLVLIGVYAVLGWLATPPASHPEWWYFKNGEAYIAVTLASIVLMAFTVILGLHVALRTSSSRIGVINTLATIFFLSAGTLATIYLIQINSRFEVQWASFIFFIGAGIGGLWWVLSGDRPSAALTLASWCCPIAVFYTVTNVLVAKPGTQESTDPLLPFLVTVGAFGFTVLAMLVPLLSEFDVAFGRTDAGGE